MASSNNIVVIGAGVSGLTTAWLLSKNSANKITIAAKFMPGDYDIEYCSPWAGADYMPVGAKNSKHADWESITWRYLNDLAQSFPEAGIHFQETIIYNREKDEGSTVGKWFSELVDPNPWFQNIVPNYRRIPQSELKSGIDNAHAFTSVCFNTPVYLAWLLSQCLKNGVVIKRAVFKHLSDAAHVHHSGRKADVIVNCTGLSSRFLGGVRDQSLYPGRGQVVLVRNESSCMASTSGTDDGDDEAAYVMTRAAGGGTILGGCMQVHSWDPNPDPNLAVRIMKRCIALSPELVKPGQGIEGLDIIRHGVGLRPMRKDGIRVEKEKIDGNWVVHNYGHAGCGYQTSFGCALTAVQEVETALQKEN